MVWDQIVGFWVVSILLVITPGADWAYCIAAGIKGRAIAPAVAGLLLGYVLLTVLVAAGVAGLIASVPLAMKVLTLVGAAYLAWLGVGLLRNPPVPNIDDTADRASAWTWIGRGFCISGLNPKALLLFLALLPQFTRMDVVWPTTTQIGMLGLVQIVNCGLVYSLVGVFSKAALGTSPRAARTIGRASGTIMVGLAVVLFVEAIRR